MINKRIYAFLFVALLSFISLNIFQSANFVETPESAIEYVEQENNIEREAKEFSYLSFDLNFDISEAQLDLGYKDEIYSLLLSDNLLRPPIFS